MPYAVELFSSLGNAKSFKAGKLCADELSQAQVLLVRSTTKVDASLLSKATQLQFVGTATAGFDHLNIDELNKRSIAVSIASGCNAVAVAQYVLSVLFTIATQDRLSLQNAKVGIVGAGSVGSAVAKYLSALDIPFVLYDPPLQQKGDKRRFVDFEKILKCDFITLHTPLIEEGEWPTHHMFDHERLQGLGKHQYLINACRGEVIDNQALIALFEARKPLNIVLDVWEGEPDINQSLISHVRLATAHIAGHTLEGKANGTNMLYRDLCKFLGVVPTLSINDFLPIASLKNYRESEYTQTCSDKITNGLDVVKFFCLQTYDISQDDRVFRTLMAQSQAFKYIRSNYQVRREFSAIEIANKDLFLSAEAKKSLSLLGFKIKD